MSIEKDDASEVTEEDETEIAKTREEIGNLEVDESESMPTPNPGPRND